MEARRLIAALGAVTLLAVTPLVAAGASARSQNFIVSVDPASTTDEVAEIYWSNLKTQFGDALQRHLLLGDRFVSLHPGKERQTERDGRGRKRDAERHSLAPRGGPATLRNECDMGAGRIGG